MLPLHGGLPPSQQTRVFNRPPKGEVFWSFWHMLAQQRETCFDTSQSAAQLRHILVAVLQPKPQLCPLACCSGTVKIVVSTNVAETSITIDDVTAVIDTGRVKEMRFDASRGIARLQETFVSQVGVKWLGAGVWNCSWYSLADRHRL